MTARRATSAKRPRKRTPAKKRARPRRKSAGKKVVRQTKADIVETELLVSWFRLLARCRGAWLQYLWIGDGSIDGRAMVTHFELAGTLEDQDSPQAEAAWSLDQEIIRQWRSAAEEIKLKLVSAKDSRLVRLARTFGLTDEELDLFQLCAAVSLDPTLTRVCAYLQDHSGRSYVTEELASRLLGAGRAGVWSLDMNVFRWFLIQRHEIGVGEPAGLSCDPQIRDWLLGRNTLDKALLGAARLVGPSEFKLAHWPVDEVAGWIERSLSEIDPKPLRILVIGPHGAGKQAFASAVARKLAMPLIVIDTDACDDASWPGFLLHAQRQAFLDRSIPALTGEGATRRLWPSGLDLFPIQFILCEPGAESAPVGNATDRRVNLSMPNAATRQSLWRNSSFAAAEWPDDELQRLAAHHRVWPGDIEQATRLGARTPAEAARLVREAARSRFGDLAQILDTPFTPDDLVLPAGVMETLEAIAFEAEERGEFWRQPAARRLFPLGTGLIVLFSGPSGTGKTMAAQVIAARLNQDLCRVNVAQLVSKWVGETPKNVERVVRVAAENNVVLFFDEADALFAKRATKIHDAQDRFANTDTAFLLQAIESYPGIAILATNLKSNIDSAFLRRLRYVVDMPKLDAPLQLTLWSRLITELAGEERAKRLEPVLDQFSKTADATGAQIKFAVLAGLFAARADHQPLSARHLLIGLDRELAKEGRAIGPRERAQILRMGAAN